MDPPLDPSGDEARRLLQRELVHPDYHDRSLVGEVLDWVGRLVDGTIDSARGAPPLSTFFAMLAFLLLALALGWLATRARGSARATRDRAVVRPDEVVSAAELRRRAEQALVPTFVFRPKDYPGREAYEAEIVRKLQALQVDLVVLAGYMRLVTHTLLAPYAGRIINIHPSLLPAFPGVISVGQALAYGVKTTGVTVHYVDSGLDSGPIILQQAVEVQDGDNEESLSSRIHAIEHELYLRAIRLIREDRLAVDGRVVRLRSPGGTSVS